MNILLNEPAMRARFDAYCDFLNMVFRFQVYCTMGLGERREDYSERAGDLKLALDGLTKGIGFVETAIFRGLLDRLNHVITTQPSMQAIAKGCEELLRRFVYTRENEFRKGYLQASAKRVAGETYSNHLMFAVMNDLESGKYDAAIQAAFKTLDAHLQRVLKLPVSEYGETLINKAFAPDSGALKLDGDPNEQRGLRNLAAGANALFRNAVAHKSVFTADLASLSELTADAISSGNWPDSFYRSFYDEMTAQTVVALVALLMKAATKLAAENNLIDAADAPKFAFGGPVPR